MDHGQHQCRVTSIVSRSGGVLLVGAVVFLVYYDESQVVMWQEEGRSGSEDYVVGRAAVADGFCDGASAGLTLSRVVCHQGVSEMLLQPFGQLAADRNLRHKVEDIPALPDSVFGQSYIYFCLARTGHSVQHHGLVGLQ